MSALAETWIYLAQRPLLWLTLTLVVYKIAAWLHRRFDASPFLTPIFTCIVLLVSLLRVTGTSYETYFQGAQFVHFLLGPATVALAVPLYRTIHKVTQHFVPLSGALLGGSIVGVLSAVGIGRLFNLSVESLLSLAPKSITIPMAVGVSEQIGGLPSLTTLFVVLTGIVGSILGPKSLDALRIREGSVRGFSLGLSAHGLGTAAAFLEDEEAGAFAGLAMGLNGALTALLMSLLLNLIGLG